MDFFFRQKAKSWENGSKQPQKRFLYTTRLQFEFFNTFWHRVLRQCGFSLNRYGKYMIFARRKYFCGFAFSQVPLLKKGQEDHPVFPFSRTIKI